MAKQKTAQSQQDAHGHKHNHIGKNVAFSLEIPWETVQNAYAGVLKKTSETVEIAGFRKGKAPEKLVEEKVGKVKLYDETAYVVLQKAYGDEVKKRNLRPVVDPQIKPAKMEEGKPWTFEVETAEAPDVELGDYKDIIKSAKAKGTIWTPEKGDPKDQKAPTEDERLRTIFSALLEKIHVTIPELLLRSEVNAALSRLVNRLESMHITLEDYLKSNGKTMEQLRQEYAMSTLATLQLEFILNAIARAENVRVDEKEIDEVIEKIEDPEMKKLGKNPYQRLQVHVALSKRKTVDFLLLL